MNSPTQRRLQIIGNEAKEKYDTEYLPEFTEHIRTVSGFDDLTLDTQLQTSAGFYYSKNSNSVTYNIKYIDIHSDDIERYSDAQELRDRMSDLLQELEKGESFSYTLRNGMTVKVKASLLNDISCRIHTSDNKEYEYFSYEDHESVSIDDIPVYSKGGTKSSSSSQSGPKSDTGTGSSGGTRSYYGWNDPYNVDTYDDPDDFANDYEDEFDDYDDAYDYWEEEHY